LGADVSEGGLQAGDGVEIGCALKWRSRRRESDET